MSLSIMLEKIGLDTPEGLARENESVFKKLLSKLKEFVANLKDYYSKLTSPTTREAQAVKDGIKYAEELVAMWDKAAKGAVENYQAAKAAEVSREESSEEALKKAGKKVRQRKAAKKKAAAEAEADGIEFSFSRGETGQQEYYEPDTATIIAEHPEINVVRISSGKYYPGVRMPKSEYTEYRHKQTLKAKENFGVYTNKDKAFAAKYGVFRAEFGINAVNKGKSYGGTATLDILPYIGEIFENAVVVKTKPDRNNDTNINGIADLVGCAVLGDRSLAVVKLNVKEYADRETKIYDNRVIEIEELTVVGGVGHSIKNDSTTPAVSSEYIINSYLNFVKKKADARAEKAAETAAESPTEAVETNNITGENVISSQDYIDWDIVEAHMKEMEGKEKITLPVWITGIIDEHGKELFVLYDGNHRYKAAEELGIAVEFEEQNHPEGLTGETLLDNAWMDSDWKYVGNKQTVDFADNTQNAPGDETGSGTVEYEKRRKKNASSHKKQTEAYDEETASIKEQIIHHQEELNKLPIVSHVVSFASSAKDTRTNVKRVTEELKATGYQVDRKGFGKILFGPKLLNSSFNYNRTEADIMAYSAIPHVLKRGIDITGRGNHKGRDYGTVTIAAPISLNGKRGNMAIVVKQTSGAFYKLHRVLDPDGNLFVVPDAKKCNIRIRRRE